VETYKIVFFLFACVIDSFRHGVLSGVDLMGRYCGVVWCVQLKKIAVFLWSGNEHYADH